MSNRFSRRQLFQSAANAGALLALGGVAPGHAAEHADLERWVKSQAERWRIPGMAAVVVQDGRTLAMFLQGLASVGLGVPVSERTRFHIASIAKHITAAAVLRLVDAGRLHLDAKLGTLIGQLPAAWREVPLHSLLTHTSGIPDYEDLVVWDRPYTRESFIEMASSRPIDFVPGESWSYSNTAYVLLGWVIDAVSGRSHARFVQDELLGRAGLRDSRVDDAEAPIDNRAEPYEWRDQELRHAIRMNGRLSGWTDGGILMSARDIAPWDAALEGDALVGRKTRERIFTPVSMSTGRSFPYGYGWSLDAVAKDGPFHWHAGSVPGFTSFYFRAPRQRLAVAVLTNIGGRSRPQRFIAMSLAERFAPGSTPLSLAPVSDRSPKLTATARRILFRGSNQLDADLFAPELAVLIRGRIGEHAVVNLGGDVARLRDLSVVQDRETGSQRERRYRLDYGDHYEHVSCGYAPDGRIFYMRLL
jgi:D-alanyl-D-alanine carboxypeptidase